MVRGPWDFWGQRARLGLALGAGLLEGEVGFDPGEGNRVDTAGGDEPLPAAITPEAGPGTVAKGAGGEHEAGAVRRRQAGPAPGRSWSVGDRVPHASFGVGEITHTFGSGEKVSIAVKFAGMGPKILDPRLAPIEPIAADD